MTNFKTQTGAILNVTTRDTAAATKEIAARIDLGLTATSLGIAGPVVLAVTTYKGRMGFVITRAHLAFNRGGFQIGFTLFSNTLRDLDIASTAKRATVKALQEAHAAAMASPEMAAYVTKAMDHTTAGGTI